MTKKYKVLITGGSRGIGKSVTEEFNSKNYEVVAPARDNLDLSKTDSIANFFSLPANKDFDILINNAGINIPQKLSEIDNNTLKKIIQINLETPFLLTKYIINHMKQNKWGRILNISSAYSFLAREGRSAYSSSKAGLDALTRSLAVEYSGDNILVNSVAPGFVDTELTRKNNSESEIENICKNIPIKRLASSSEIAKIVFFLASKENTYITGQTIVVDGGLSIV